MLRWNRECSHVANELLERAIDTGDCEAIAEAIESSDGMSYRTADGVTCLGLATAAKFGSEGTLSRVECLLGLGAKVADERAKSGPGTSVHQAALNGHVETLQALLSADGRSALDTFDDLGRTPLMCAVQSRDRRCVEILVAAGASLDVRDEMLLGDTALIHAVRSRDLALVEVLMKAGANPDVRGWMQLSAHDRLDDLSDDAGLLVRMRVLLGQA